jgi:RNA polymerase sigma factor (sigma-70 family)
MSVASEKRQVDQLIGHLFRHEAGKMAAVLTRYLGAEHFEVAQDLVQDTLLKAMETWPFHSIPDNPSAWLYRVARNRAIDFIRSQQSQAKGKKNYEQEAERIFQFAFEEDEINDSVLRMMFTCCHPSIPQESQIALTLKTLGGLSISEIAFAFLTNEETIAKRVYRAKEKIRDENIQLDPPSMYELSARLNSVLKVLYLLFNEGYYSHHPSAPIREDLCEEAMRLTYLLVQHPTISLPKVKALMALMCLQASRFDARTSDSGEIILLEFQDRSKWSQPLIEKGLHFLSSASEGDQLSEYHIEAAIASVHALAPTWQQTRWPELVRLYDALEKCKPGLIVALNHSIAIGYAQSPKEGIFSLEKIQGLENNHLYLTALGNFHLLAQHHSQAKIYFKQAIKEATLPREIELIKSKLHQCEAQSAAS